MPSSKGEWKKPEPLHKEKKKKRICLGNDCGKVIYTTSHWRLCRTCRDYATRRRGHLDYMESPNSKERYRE